VSDLASLPVGPVSRVVFLGTPDLAVVSLRALVNAGIEVALVVTRPDARRGRGSALTPSPVKAAALELGLPVSHQVDDVLDTKAQLGVVVAFGQLIRRPVLEKLPMVNLHLSLLPRWRGAAPVERALLAGDATTGVCLMQLEVGLDTGPVLGRVETPITATTTAGELRQHLAVRGADLLIRQLGEGLAPAQPQVGETTYAAKIDPAELMIDWSRPAVDIDRLIRVGGAYTTFRTRRLRILSARVLDDLELSDAAWGQLHADRVATASGWLHLIEVQPEGKRPMPAADWCRGVRLEPGERLGYGSVS
jgi:methionyl-tRNA formyltransferase